MISEKTAAPWRTPQGFLIKNDVVYSNNTAFGDGDIRISLATSCELELWQVCEAQREKIGKLAESSLALLEALSKEVKTSAERRMRDTEVMEAFESVKAAIAEAEKS